MSKKDKKNNKKHSLGIWKAIDENYEKAKEEASNFYEDGILVDISKQDDVAKIVADIQKTPDDQALSEEQMQKECLKIREKVMAGKEDNIEIDFTCGIQKFEGREHQLGDTLFKAVESTTHKTFYFHYKKGDKKDVLVFIGGDNVKAILAAKDDKGNVASIGLDEFHLLSISENSTSEKEIGLMTSYIWLRAKIYSSVILAFNLDPVKNLLLGEAMYAKEVENEKRIGLEKDDTDDERE